MGTIADLNTLPSMATGDLLLVRDISDAADKDKKMTLGSVAWKDSAAILANRVAAWKDANSLMDAGFAYTDVARLSVPNTFTGLLTTNDLVVQDELIQVGGNGAYGSYRWVMAGYPVSGSRLNLVALNVSAYSGVTIKVTYSQLNTGVSPDEQVMGQGVATLTRDNLTTFFVGASGYLGTQHASIQWQTSGGRVIFYLSRTTGAAFRIDSAAFRCAYVEICGSVSGVVINPTTI